MPPFWGVVLYLCTEDQICTEGDDMTGHDIVEIATLTMLGILVINLAVGWIQDHLDIK